MPRSAIQFALLVLFTLVACANPRYQPSSEMSTDEAKRVLYRSLEEQPQGYGATAIAVTNEKLTFAGRQPTTFYYDGFGSAEISGRKRKGHVVWVYDKADIPRFRVVVSTLEGAKRFVDALYVMSLSTVSQYPAE